MNKIGMSNFARNRHQKGNGNSYFAGTEEELIALVNTYWTSRSPGYGRTDLTKVVVVPVCVFKFVSETATIKDEMTLKASVERRQPHEDPSIKVLALNAKPDPVNFAKVVCYSADTLLENNGERSGDFDWEIVALIVSSVEDEPMHPLTMSRNYLQQPGGTFADYTAKQFAEAIWYWSQKVKVK